MKYKKGEFTTVPNTSSLELLSPTAQALFLWVCIYADGEGRCFPSRTTLSKNLNCSVRTVDQYLKELVDKGFIEKTHRFYGNEKTTNLYQILQVEVQETAQPSAENSTTPGAKSAHRTISILTKPILSEQSSGKYVIVPSDEENEKTKKRNTSSMAKEIANIFKEVTGRYSTHWIMRVNQREAAENLYRDRTPEKVRAALKFYMENKTERYCPRINSPLVLEEKWFDLLDYKKIERED